MALKRDLHTVLFASLGSSVDWRIGKRCCATRHRRFPAPSLDLQLAWTREASLARRNRGQHGSLLDLRRVERTLCKACKVRILCGTVGQLTVAGQSASAGNS
jgi:hypothetical protein